MGNITNTTIELVKDALKKAFFDYLISVNTEVQDNGDFLLIALEIDSPVVDIAMQIALDRAGDAVSAIIPSRQDEHAWMLNVTYRGALLDSIVGGLKQAQSDI